MLSRRHMLAGLVAAGISSSDVVHAKPRRRRRRDDQPVTPTRAPTVPAAPPPARTHERARQAGHALGGCFSLLAVFGGILWWLSKRGQRAGGAREVWRSLAQRWSWQFVPGHGQDVGRLWGHAGPATIEASAGYTASARLGSYPYTRVTTHLPVALGGRFEISQRTALSRGNTGDAALDEAIVVTGPDVHRILNSPVRDALLALAAVTDSFGPIGPGGPFTSSNEAIIQNPAQLRNVIDAHAALAASLTQTFARP